MASPSSSSTLPPSIHVHPHATHISESAVPGPAGEIEDHDYEALPVGAGWGVNMMAGAMVSAIRTDWALFQVRIIS